MSKMLSNLPGCPERSGDRNSRVKRGPSVNMMCIQRWGFRRLVGNTLSRQFHEEVEAACAPFLFAFSTRAGTDCVGHAIRALTHADVAATVLSIDGMVIKSVQEMRHEPPSPGQTSLVATVKEHQSLHKIKNQYELCVGTVSLDQNFLEVVSTTETRAVEEAVGGRVHRLTTQVVIWRQCCFE